MRVPVYTFYTFYIFGTFETCKSKTDKHNNVVRKNIISSNIFIRFMSYRLRFCACRKNVNNYTPQFGRFSLNTKFRTAVKNCLFNKLQTIILKKFVHVFVQVYACPEDVYIIFQKMSLLYYFQKLLDMIHEREKKKSPP